VESGTVLSAQGTNSPFIHVHWMFSNVIVLAPWRWNCAVTIVGGSEEFVNAIP
jgi:hypothetical protein